MFLFSLKGVRLFIRKHNGIFTNCQKLKRKVEKDINIHTHPAGSERRARMADLVSESKSISAARVLQTPHITCAILCLAHLQGNNLQHFDNVSTEVASFYDKYM